MTAVLPRYRRRQFSCAATVREHTPKRPLSPGKSLPSSGHEPARTQQAKGHGAPASFALGTLLSASIRFEGAKCGFPEPPRRLHDLCVVKALEAQVPPLSVLLGLFEALQLRINPGHHHSRRGGIRRCTCFETSTQAAGAGDSKEYPRHCPSSSPSCQQAPHRGPIRSAVRPSHSEHLSGAKRHVR